MTSIPAPSTKQVQDKFAADDKARGDRKLAELIARHP